MVCPTPTAAPRRSGHDREARRHRPADRPVAHTRRDHESVGPGPQPSSAHPTGQPEAIGSRDARALRRADEREPRACAPPRRLPDTQQTVLEVTDRGPGIPAKQVAHIFEPFFTTSEMGTGLGLYIARQLCETNQATLDYYSLAGGGSCFRISFHGQPGAAIA